MTGIRFHGHDALLTVTVDALAAPLLVRAQGPVPARPGERVGLSVTGRATLHPAP
ncbi:hypothetical protein ABZ508_12725 [Streptomyces lavendulocolor]|uniref:Transport-associated OB type 2 domain-containing protein n=1 Tax=Streptomyces lavendulocolor TaxID=67316 RepID=A0ABV2W4W5_9ACTN